MRIILLLFTIIFAVAIASSSFAQIKISGDAKLRPRLDIKDNGAYGDKSTNGYYYYLARLNFKSELGEGWFGHVQLGTNGNGYFTGMFGDPSTPGGSVPTSPVSVDGAARGTVDFMLVYFGRKTEKFGYMGGLLPIDGINNPMYDVHYYSDKMVDVPFYLFSNNGAHGFSGYIGFNNGGKINATILVDNNNGSKIEDSLGVVTKDVVDQFTFILDAPLKFSNVTVQPVFLFTVADQYQTEAPMTYGVNVITPKFSEFKLSGSFAMSTQKEDGTDEYDVWYARVKAARKIGKGTLTVWYDLANKTVKLTGGDEIHDFSYLWLSYTLPVYSSDKGSVTIKPTWRRMNEKVEDVGVNTKDFVRNKIEIAIDFSFR